jgi:predicted Zn-dependent protease
MPRLWLFAQTAALVHAQDWSELERALGQRLAEDIRNRHKSVNSEVRGYVQRTGNRFASPYTFEIIVDDAGVYEPIALPGGYIVASTGLLLAAHDESEFAGMLAHAAGHLAEGHYKSRSAPSGAVPMIFIGGDPNNSLIPASRIPERREFELAADRWSVAAMARAGWDPAALLRYIERMQPPDNSKSSPLPARETRIANLQEAIALVPPGTYSETADFSNVRDQFSPAPRKIPSLRHPQ